MLNTPFHDWYHKKEKWKFLTFIGNLTRVIWVQGDWIKVRVITNRKVKLANMEVSQGVSNTPELLITGSPAGERAHNGYTKYNFYSITHRVAAQCGQQKIKFCVSS